MKEKEFSISVTIPSYCRTKYLIQTIKEVLKQKHPAVREIIVADQSPPSAYGEGEWQQMQKWIEDRTIIYKHLKQANANAARNCCLSLASGDILLYLDDDVLLPPHFIDLHHKMYLQNFNKKKVIAVGGMSHHRKDTRTEGSVDEINFSNYTNYTTKDFLHYKRRVEPLKKDGTLKGCNMSVLKNEAIAIGGFDEHFTSYFDEADFCFRLKKQIEGEGVLVVNKNAYLIHLRAVQGGHRKRNQSLSDELPRQLSFNLFYIRHYPFWSIVPKLIKNLRVGPFMKRNFLSFRKFWGSLYYYFRSIQIALQLKHSIKSPFRNDYKQS
jgi:GT2 family glycosyltransferase